MENDDLRTSRTWTATDMDSMDIHELWDLHYTRSEVMEGATRMRQHSNLHAQIQAFEKLLQHSNSNFPREKLYQNLKLLHEGVPYLKGNRIVHEKPTNHGKITSVNELRALVDKLQKQKRKGIHKEEENTLVQYFESFFNDLQYMKNLKAYFDERIYSCLYQYYYDPLDSTLEDLDDKSSEEADSGHSSQNGSDDETKIPKPTPRTKFSLVSKIQSESETPEYSPERERLTQVVRELYDLNLKWGKMFDETKLDVSLFDQESSYEICSFRNIDEFKDIFRLVPDIYTKSLKSNRLAKVWWMMANKLYKIEPDKSVSNMASLDQKSQQLRNLVTKFGEDIVRSQQQIIVFENDLAKLKTRGHRAQSLTSDSKQIQQRKDKAEKKYNDVVKRRNELKEKLSETIAGTVKYNLLAMELRDLDLDLGESYDEFKVLEGHSDLLRGETNTEEKSRPQVQRFTETIEGKIAKLKEFIAEKRIEKRRCDRTLALLKANTDKMKEIVQKAVKPLPETEPEPEELDGPSFFITEASYDGYRGQGENDGQGDKATHDAVQERFNLLYQDFDFDSRFRPASLATTQDQESNDLSDSESLTPGNFKETKKTRRRYVDHTFPLLQDEYTLKPK